MFYPESPGIDGWVESIMQALKESESFVPLAPNYSLACKYEKWRDEINDGSVVISDPVPEEVIRIYCCYYYFCNDHCHTVRGRYHKNLAVWPLKVEWMIRRGNWEERQQTLAEKAEQDMSKSTEELLKGTYTIDEIMSGTQTHDSDLGSSEGEKREDEDEEEDEEEVNVEEIGQPC